MEAQCKDGVRADVVASLIVAAGERRSLLGVGFENMMRSWVMKWGAQQGLGVLASRWLGGGIAKAQGRGMGWGAIACHHHHVLFRICLSVSAFCLGEKGCWRTSLLCTHIHEFWYISHLFHFYLFYCHIWYLILYAWRYHRPTHMELPNTHAHTYGIHTHTRTHTL